MKGDANDKSLSVLLQYSIGRCTILDLDRRAFKNGLFKRWREQQSFRHRDQDDPLSNLTIDNRVMSHK